MARDWNAALSEDHLQPAPSRTLVPVDVVWVLRWHAEEVGDPHMWELGAVAHPGLPRLYGLGHTGTPTTRRVKAIRQLFRHARTFSGDAAPRRILAMSAFHLR